MKPRRIAIIGAGISGLSGARALAAAGAAVTVFEKSRGLGGRCATRRWEGCVVDHGAQYFTMRDAEFREEIMRLGGAEILPLAAPILDETGTARPTADRFYHVGGNNRLGRLLAAGLDVRLERPVSPPQPHPGGGWTVEGERFDAIVSSAPGPQTLALLGRPADPAAFAPCLTALFAYAGDPSGPATRAYARSARDAALAWSACENHKRGRVPPGMTVLVAQASPAFSTAHLEAEPAAWSILLREAIESTWELDPAARRGTFTHRWRYARRTAPVDLGELPPHFFVTGDTVTESRVESAWLAGRATARAVLADG